LTGHSGSVPDASASADGRFVLTASADKTARLWDASTGAQLVVFRHPDQVESAQFSPDGTRALTAADDAIARIWDIRVPPLEQQIRWVQAAQFESLSSAERFQLGLLTPTHIRSWPAGRTRCDDSAGAPYDPDRHAPGVMYEQIVGDIAMQACGTEQRESVGEPRWVYEHGRALLASGDIVSARHAFERAIDGKYRAARVDLAMLLTHATGLSAADDNVLDTDVPKAIQLYEQAWRDGVAIAAFQLGRLYEVGVPAHGNRSPGLVPDSQRAWEWYKRGAAALEPNALARLAERDSIAAFDQSSAVARNSDLLASFRHYSAAAERARSEDWPDESWVVWRYRRASLARMLEREGMLKEVGDAYAAILSQTGF
jgi:TPR repeat protein